MLFKTFPLLSKYVIAENGTVVEVESGEQVELTSKKNYLLQTDEEAGDCKVKLKRRFTPDEIGGLFNNAKAKPFTEPVAIQNIDEDIHSVGVIKAGRLPEHVKKFPYILVKGLAYQSSRDAAKETGENYNTILRKAKANKDGYFYIEE